MPINLASGKEITIKEIAEIIKKEIGYKGKIIWDKDMPIGPNRRNVSIDLANKKINFNPKISIKEGIKKTVDWYINLKN
jgi:GDP-L-fucose synthase